MKLATSRLIDGSPYDGIDMVIKDLYLEPKIDAMMRDVLDPSQWKELSKETSSKILPCGDGSDWKTFKPIASLITKGKLKQTQARSFPIVTVKVKYHIVPFGELNGVPIAFVARFEVISKSIDRIFVSHGGQRKWVTNSGYEEKIDNEKANRLELKVSLDRNQHSG
ncbi:hypothetical protein Tco_0648743 [Tanacetum coccineum]